MSAEFEKTIRFGNAATEGSERRGWFLGGFMPEGPLHHSDVEVKWANHSTGDERTEWADAGDTWTLSILVRGKFKLTFPESEMVLSEEGDYALWGPAVRHTWKCESDCTIVTVRWREESQIR